ncbi:MAG: mannose-1-phosphate guanylyltransferase [Bacteroidaceae bacterium]|nr:mannose-1-phosphate guanylyltransferase [Bacteroidaceae bacterium]
MSTHVVIMAGGVGSRFWPLSTPQFPKQFIDILGCGRSLIQLTVDRFQGLCPMSNFWVVTNENYVGTVHEQLPDIPEGHILAEPAARNTAPCIAWACRMIKEEDAQANIVVTPSDAVVMNTQEFQRVIKESLDFTASRQCIVTIGIKPNRPETGYGYVCMKGCDTDGVAPVLEFKEKPDLETAQEYLKAGNYLWNAGIFVWNVKTVLGALECYKPVLSEQIDTMVRTGNVKEIFPTCEKISIDFAVMEPASHDSLVYTHPADFGWSDLGNWSSLHEKLAHDAQGNGSVGNVSFYECDNCVVHASGLKRVVLQGLDGYIVSEKDGQLLVCRRSEEQRIREFSSAK